MYICTRIFLSRVVIPRNTRARIMRKIRARASDSAARSSDFIPRWSLVLKITYSLSENFAYVCKMYCASERDREMRRLNGTCTRTRAARLRASPSFRRGSAELKPFYQKWQHVITMVILGFEALILAFSLSLSLSLFLHESVHVTRTRLPVFTQCGRK